MTMTVSSALSLFLATSAMVMANSSSADPLPAPKTSIRMISSASAGATNTKDQTITNTGETDSIAYLFNNDTFRNNYGTGYSYVNVSSFGPSILSETVADKEGLATGSGFIQGTYDYFMKASGSGPLTIVDWSAAAAFAASPINYSYQYVGAVQAGLTVFSVDHSQTLLQALLSWNNGNISISGFGNSTDSVSVGLSASVLSSGTILLNTGTIYDVQLSMYNATGIGTGPGDFATGGASAYIDPLFTVSSRNVNASAYSLAFSDGVTQAVSLPVLSAPTLPSTSAVPEASTWAMMVLGVGAVGASLRRRAKVKTRVAFA